MNIDPEIIARYIRRGKYKHTDLGLERECSKCKEFWPADTEFWQAQKGQLDGFTSQCKACLNDTKTERRRRAA